MSTIQSQDTNDRTEKPDEDSKIDDSYNEDDKLAFNSKLLLDVNKYAKRESVDSVQIKYSIDVTNAPKNRLHEYLNNDLLDELDKEPICNAQPPMYSFLSQNLVQPPYQKKKKPFEIREGDWTCFDCHNLNFSFRVKCNRCGLPKSSSDGKYEEFKAKKMNSALYNTMK